MSIYSLQSRSIRDRNGTRIFIHQMWVLRLIIKIFYVIIYYFNIIELMFKILYYRNKMCDIIEKWTDHLCSNY